MEHEHGAMSLPGDEGATPTGRAADVPPPMPLMAQPIPSQPLQVLSYATPVERSGALAILIRVGAAFMVVAGVILVGGSLFAAIWWMPVGLGRRITLDYLLELLPTFLLGVLFLMGGVPRLRNPRSRGKKDARVNGLVEYPSRSSLDKPGML